MGRSAITSDQYCSRWLKTSWVSVSCVSTYSGYWIPGSASEDSTPLTSAE